ncbi:homoprotocatechuate degradation regulator HpaR [Oxalobacteraceae bacterium GrIS 2.11]
MKKQIAYRNLPQRLLKARECLMAHFRPVLQHYGVTEQQWRVLRILDEHGQLEPREIGHLCHIQSPSMAGVLARMELLDLIVRTRSSTDQRRVLVRLAAQGQQLVGVMAPLIDTQYQYLEEAIGKPVLDDLFKVLESFIAAQDVRVKKVALPE